MGSLHGEVALVTGAGRGIGRATAERLAAEGAHVVLNDVPSAGDAGDALEAVRGHGVEAMTYEADVSDHHAVQEMVVAVEQRFGHIDILVNNAGIGHRHDVLTLPEDQWNRVLAVNLTGQFLVAQAVLPGMIRRGRGRIVNVASELALIGDVERTAYCAAKAGVIGFTRALAREVAPHGVLVNCVAPGPTGTAMLKPESRSEEYRRSIPLQRFGEPREIAAAICFLVGPDSSWTTGQVFSPNGGAVI